MRRHNKTPPSVLVQPESRRDKENQASVTAAPASGASSVSTSAPTLVRPLRTGTLPVVPALNKDHTVFTPAVAEIPRDLSPASTTHPTPEDKEFDIIILRAQLAVLRNELKLVKERAAGGPNKEPAQIERPDKVTNLQAAMALMNDPGTYHQIRTDIKRYALAAGLLPETRWSRQDVGKLARVCNMVKKQHPFLKCYVGDWPVKEYLKRHFANQRSYKRRVLRARAAAAAQGKGKGKAVREGSWGDLDSGMDASDDADEKSYEEEAVEEF